MVICNLNSQFPADRSVQPFGSDHALEVVIARPDFSTHMRIQFNVKPSSILRIYKPIWATTEYIVFLPLFLETVFREVDDWYVRLVFERLKH